MNTEDQKWERFLLPLLRVLQLFCPDEWHLRREQGQQNLRKILPADEEWLAAREPDFLDFAERYLEALNTETLKAHDQTLQKALALAGWFGLLFAAFALPLTLMKDGTAPPPHEWPGLAWFFLAIAVVMLLISFFGACRVLWRFQLLGDVTYWFLDERFPTQISLRRERIAELIERIPINKGYVAVKARLYQGAVWSFYLAVCFEILGIATLFASARTPPPKSEEHPVGITITSTPSQTPSPSATAVKPTPVPAATNTAPRKPSPPSRRVPRKAPHRHP